ncbi:Uncharacterized protein DBV15_06077 [Temnothorax longispinosus]|uniref:Uncharacterized protein n=1 Tax=Temnothorax longispinosus TaxID=300112 RepID=A0A4S2KD02_9HYME|nr:Uncharacterized protein DBV15_06077 [Temnothorax longispinosus]
MNKDMNKDPVIIEAWFPLALNMISSRKRTKTVAGICDKFDYVPMLKRIKIKKEKKDYLNYTMKFEAAVKEILAGANDSSIARRYVLDLEALRIEIQRFRNSGAAEYEYDNGRIFSLKEELMLLEILATIPQPFCTCPTCALDRLPYLAYHLALRKGKSYPREWDEHRQAGKEWQTNFKIKYDYEISNSFLTECNRKM